MGLRWPSKRTQGIASLILLIGLTGFYLREEYRSAQLCPNPQSYSGGNHEPDKAAQNGSPGTSADERIAEYTWWLSLFTFVLAVSTIGLWITGIWAYVTQTSDTRRSLKIAKESADTARDTLIASHRAWLKVEVIPGDLIFYETQGMHTPTQIKIENIGNAPAIHIEAHAWLYAGTQPLAPLRAHSAEVARKALDGGFSLLPGERYPEFTGYSSVGNDAFLSTNQVTENTDGYGRITLYVLICVDYSFPSNGANHHQFQVAYELKMDDEMPIAVTEGVIPARRLKFGDVGLGITRLVT